MTNVRMRRFLLLVGFLCLSAVVNAEWQGANGLWYEWIDKGTKAAVKVIQVPNNESAYSGSYTIPANILSPEDPEVLVPVTEIAVSAFKGATDLTDVIIEATITTIGKETFKNSGLTSIVLPPTLEEIGTNAFENTQLANISIPATVTYIGGSAFNNCTKLKKATFDSIEALCGITFDGSTSNPLYYAHDLYFGDSKKTQLSIPATVTSIPAYAFQNCTSLTEVTIQEEQEGEVLKGVTTIGASAFAGCTSLASISIPSTITTIGSNAFNIKNSTIAAENRKVTFASFESLYNIDFKDIASNPLTFAHHLYIGSSMDETFIVTLPSVTNINPRIFAGAGLISQVIIPESVKYIGDDAFYGCSNISTVIFNGGINQLKEMRYGEGKANPLAYGATPVIQGMALGSLSFTDNIADNSFTNAKWLTEITIGPNVTSIGKNAFKGCTNLSTITIEDKSSLHSIGDEAFNGCVALKSVDLPNSLTSIGKLAFRDTKLSSIIIPENCINLGTSIFENCTELTTATFSLSANLATLPNYIFKGCVNLRDITISEKTNTIGEGAFQGCSWMSVVPLSDNLSVIEKNAFANAFKGGNITELILTGKGKLNEIGEGAFSGCENITMVSLPSTIRYIKKNAFNGCSSLAHLYLYQENPELVVVHEQAFDNRKSEITLHVENEEAKLAYQVSNIWKDFKEIVTKRIVRISFIFNGECTDPLTGLVYELTGEAGKPIEDVETLNYLIQLPNRDDLGVFKSFDGWYSEQLAYTLSTIMPSEDIVFYGYYSKEVTEGQLVYLLRPGYQTAYYNYINKATVIGNQLTQSNQNVVIPDTLYIDEKKWVVSSIESHAFEGADIYTMHLPNTIAEIGEAAFKNCKNLQSINIPSSLELVNWNLFEGCTALSTIDIPTSIKHICYQAFCNSGLTEITIPASVSYMQEEVFKDCKNLESVVFAEGFNIDIPKYTFWNCTKLTNVTLRNTMKTIGLNAFQNCSSLKNIDFLPNDLSTISNYAFAGCSGLSRISLPKNVSRIGSKTFSGCSNLTQITVNSEESTPSASKDAFDDNTYENASLFVKNELMANFQDDETWGKFIYIYEKVQKKLTYVVNGESYKELDIISGSPIIPINAESIIKEDKFKDRNIDDFSGWKDLPEVMPCENITVEGNFQYEIKYFDGSIESENRILDDTDFKYFYGDKVTIPTEKLERIGYTYTLIGLLDDEVSEYNVPKLNMTMPAKDLNVIVSYKKIEITEDGITYKIVESETPHAEVVSANKDITNATIKASIEYEGNNYPVTIIQQGAFKRQSKLESITFEENSNVNTICDEAFSYCSALAEINDLPLSLYSIGQQAFANTALTIVTVPYAQKMGKEIFLNCTKLKQVEFADNLTVIPERTFSGCNSIEVVDLKNIETIDDYAFYGCVSIQSLSIPACVTKIGDHAFWNVFGEGDNIVVLGTSLPTAQQTTFDDTAYDKASLTVSVETEDIVAWGEFHYQEGDITSLPCDDPVISNDNGKLYVKCPTDNATIVISVTVDGVNGKERRVDNLPKDQASEITLKKTIKVTAYATKEHMRRSKTVEKTYKFEDVNLDGKINTVDATEILKMLVE